MRELSPIVRAVLDARDEAIVIVDARGGVQVQRAAARSDNHDRFVPRVKHRAHNGRQLPHTRATYRDRALRINEAGVRMMLRVHKVASAGSRSSKLLPPPGRAAYASVPPCSSARRRAMESPRPAPPPSAGAPGGR